MRTQARPVNPPLLHVRGTIHLPQCSMACSGLPDYGPGTPPKDAYFTQGSGVSDNDRLTAVYIVGGEDDNNIRSDYVHEIASWWGRS